MATAIVVESEVMDFIVGCQEGGSGWVRVGMKVVDRERGWRGKEDGIRESGKIRI